LRIHTLSDPATMPVKARRLPSGDQAGWAAS
jgi:hypothetical protein